MNCLFVFNNSPLSPNYSGGASRCLGSFLALSKLGIGLNVVRLLEKRVAQRVLTYEAEQHDETALIRGKTKSWADVVYSQPDRPRTRLDIIRKAAIDPVALAFPEVASLGPEFRETCGRIGPDFIWAEWTLCAALTYTSDLKVPWVYSHHDWIYRIYQVRRNASSQPLYFTDRILSSTMRRVETQAVKRSTVVVTGSATEAAELDQIASLPARIIPTTYTPGPHVQGSRRANQPVRIIHLGGLTTTANHLGLTAYLRDVHQPLMQRCEDLRDRPQLFVVGEVKNAKEALLAQLRSVGATLTGPVYDLGTILRPFDIAIIPYEFDTGTRTKLPLLFNYAQVVVTTQAAVAGSAEVMSGGNCVVLPSLCDFPDALAALADDPTERERIGRKARETFERCFTVDSQLNLFDDVVSKVV